MEWLAETLEAIRGMAVREADTLAHHFVMPPGKTEPDYVYFQRGKDGLLERRAGDVGPRDYTVYRVKDFIAAVSKLPSPKQAVFVGKHAITAILDETGDRRDRVTMPLSYTGQFAALVGLSGAKKMPQDDFLDFLRIDLAGCVLPDVVSLFRQLKFTKNDSGDASYETGRQQVSRSVLREIVAGGKEIPDEIVVQIEVYEELWGDSTGAALRWAVICAVVIDFENGKFTLIPLAGQLNKARIMTQENIADTIATGLPEALVVCGEP